jgi:hypothetical protein
LESPNGDFKIVIAHVQGKDLEFAVFYKGTLITNAQNLALALDDGERLPCLSTATESRFAALFISVTNAESVRTAKGQVEYNERSISLRKGAKTEGNVTYGMEKKKKIVFRAYDGGIAYRYELATKPGETITIKNELTEFIFPDDYPCHEKVSRQVGLFRSTVHFSRMITLSQIKQGFSGPIYFDIPHGPSFVFASIPKNGFALMDFQPGRQLEGTFSNLYDSHGRIDRTGTMTAIVPMFDNSIVVRGTGRTAALPWRILVVAPPLTDGEGMLQSLLED